MASITFVDHQTVIPASWLNDVDANTYSVLADYTALRAYNGSSKTADITGYLVSAAPSGIAGTFTCDDNDTTSGAVITGSVAPFFGPPAAPTLGSSVAGALGATTYYVKITYITAAGETLPSAESSRAVAANSVLTVTSPVAQTGATGYNVYVSTTTNTETLQNTTPIAIGTGWTEPTTGLIAGAALPSANTAGSILTVSAVTNGTLAAYQSVNLSDTGVQIGWIRGLISGAGGTGTYTIDQSTSLASMAMTADNGGTYLVAANGKRWKRSYRGSVNVQWFGADGLGSTDNTPEIASALAGNDAVFFPRGTYKMIATIPLSAQNYNLYADGDATIVTPPGGFSCFYQVNRGYLFQMEGLTFTGQGIAFAYNGGAAAYPGEYFEYSIRKCKFLQSSASAPAISLIGVREGAIKDCYFETNQGIYYSYAINPEVIDCVFKNCAINVFANAGTEGVKIIGGTALGSAIGLKAQSVAGIQLTGVLWDYCDQTALIYGCSNVGISNCYLSTRSAGNYALWIGIYNTTRSTNVSITGCPGLITNYNNAAASAVHIEYSDGVKFIGNQVLNWQANGVELYGVTQVLLDGNDILPKAAAGTYSISSGGADDSTVKIRNNNLGKPISVVNTRDIWGNSGYVTESSGEASASNGVTSFTIAHGLSMAPLKGQVKITPTSVVNGATEYFISAVDATNITVTFNAALTAGASFSWSAQIKP